MIDYVFHLKPVNLQGDILYPLNLLKDIYPEIYNTHADKYSYRKELMETQFPIINCLWNDVLHLSPVDIADLINYQIKIFKEAGMENNLDLARINNRRYFRIDIKKLNQEKLYIYNITEASSGIKEAKEKIINDFYNWQEGQNLLPSQITKGQIDYFKKCSQDFSLPRYLFTAIPHVLYWGKINLNIMEELTYRCDL